MKKGRKKLSEQELLRRYQEIAQLKNERDRLTAQIEVLTKDLCDRRRVVTRQINQLESVIARSNKSVMSDE